MGGRVSGLAPEDIEDLQKCSHFSEAEIIDLYRRFKRLDRDKSGFLSSSDLLAIPEFASNPLAPTRLVPIFLYHINETGDDALFLAEKKTQTGPGLSFRGFIKILSVFHPSASLKEKLQFAFKVFDADDDGKISKSELMDFLRLMVGPHLSSDELSEIARRTFEAVDSGIDETIRWEDFFLSMSHVDVRRLMSMTTSACAL